MKKIAQKTFMVFIALAMVVTSFTQPVFAQDAGTDDPQNDLGIDATEEGQAKADFFTENNIVYYDPSGGQCGSTSGQGVSELEGYKLPATKGKTGFEEAVNANGQIPSGGRVTFAKHASLGQEYRDYYITMRWRYVKWNWNGTSTGADNKQFSWMNAKPRKVLVTNTRSKKSIIAVALEAGPAPWTGVDTSPNNNPKQGWKNPQDGTPNGYTGRVSGFPPKAIKALDAKQGMANSTGGGGDELLYSWAPDQNAKPGPTTVVQGEVPAGSPAGTDEISCADQGDAFVTPDGYAMPIGLPKANISNGHRWPCRTICHHDGTGAFDLAHKKTVSSSGNDGLTAGVSIYAIHDGVVKMTKNTYNGIGGCGSIQYAENDGNGDWTYWYGHINSKLASGVKAGAKFKAGHPLGEVGPRKCTGNGSYPHLHIDRGSPKGHYGGSVSSRDRGFVKQMDVIYQAMP